MDGSGNLVKSFTGPVTMAIGRDASLLGNAELHGTKTVKAVGGVARFSNLSINKVGVGYTLTAAFGSGSPKVESARFDILAP